MVEKTETEMAILAARPAPIDLEAAETAVIVVDMQNAFGWVSSVDAAIAALQMSATERQRA